MMRASEQPKSGGSAALVDHDLGKVRLTRKGFTRNQASLDIPSFELRICKISNY